MLLYTHIAESGEGEFDHFSSSDFDCDARF